MSGTKDSRQLLNLVLRHFYERGGTIHLLSEAHDGRIAISRRDANAAYATLIRDGHIEQVKVSDPNFPAIPVASITGQGRVFLEQGGYRDESTVFDRLVKRAKNHPVLAWVIFIFTILAAIMGVLGVIVKALDFFRPQH